VEKETHTWYNLSVAKFEIDVSGDLAGVLTLPKQINFAASRSINDTLTRTQKAILAELPDDFIIRTGWATPGRRYGINVRFAKPSNLEGSVGTAADWLLEAEGFHGGVKTPDIGGKSLANPNIDHTRHGIRNIVARGEKARRLLDNASRTKAFKIKSKKTGAELIMQRIGLDESGNPLVNKRGQYLRGRGKKVKSKVVLKYVLIKTSKVPYHPVITRNGVVTFRLHFGSYWRQNFEKAIRTARM
jgi:hypothetical protein